MNKAFAIVVTLLLSAITISAQSVSLVTCNWEPFYGESLVHNGFITEIVNEAFDEVNFICSTEFKEWSIALEEARQLKYDGLMGAYKTAEREKNYLYSYPLYSIKIVFLTRKDNEVTYNGKLENLKEYTIGVSEGYANEKSFDEATFLNKKAFSGPEELLQKLISGDVDIIVINQDTARHLLIQKFNSAVSQLKALGPSLTEQSIYVAINKQNPNASYIIDQFNKGLTTLINNDRIKMIYQEHISGELQ